MKRTHLINTKLVIHFLGLLLILNGGMMLLCLPFGLYYHEPIAPILYASAITIIIGLICWISTKMSAHMEIGKRDGYVIVTFGWIAMALFGTLPYLFSETIPEFTNAFFESMSGYTTTGSTILDHIESQPKSILFWRSLTQWIGGMGIIVLAIAILPHLGIGGGAQLFSAESPGMNVEKLKPRIRSTASRLWLIYIGLTVAELILLIFGEMDFYDAINHAFTTVSSGGFSIKDDSIAHYNSPFVEYVVMLFMLLSGTNFALIYFGVKGDFSKILKNEEFRYYIFIISILTLICFFSLSPIVQEGFESVFRIAAFQVVSIISTTGYSTADYTSWSGFLTLLFFIMLFIGGSSGSTAGGLKIGRHLILFRNGIKTLTRVIHPSAVIPIRLNKKSVDADMVSQVYAHAILCVMIFVIGILVMTFLGIDFETALGSVATTLGNVGPGIGNVGPFFSFNEIPSLGKWVLSFIMLIGRLEILTVLTLLTWQFWYKL